MRPAPDGKLCEFIPCNDNGAIFPSGTCSPYKEKKCVEGVLVDKASECGCPANKVRENETCTFICQDGTREGKCSPNYPLQCINGALAENIPQCACPVQISQTCNATNQTNFHDVTYLFDRGFNKTVSESYTFENVTCHEVQNYYSGLNCSMLNSTKVNSTPIYLPGPELQTVKSVPCDRCPAICARSPPVNLTCGPCSCPPNYGFCDVSGSRGQINDTRIYCGDELLQKQKKTGAGCKINFECRTDACGAGKCYNPDFFGAILDWFTGLLEIDE